MDRRLFDHLHTVLQVGIENSPVKSKGASGIWRLLYLFFKVVFSQLLLELEFLFVEEFEAGFDDVRIINGAFPPGDFFQRFINT